MLSSSTFLTLDGVMSDPHVWHPAYASDESLALLAEQMDRADVMLIGRRTYDEFASWWPHQGDDVPLASRTNAIPKRVVTSARGPLDWHGASRLEGDVVPAVRALKDQVGDVALAGSGTLFRALLAAGLIDEMRITLDPLVLGTGLRLFAGVPVTGFELVERIDLPKGVQYLAYRPVRRDDG